MQVLLRLSWDTPGATNFELHTLLLNLRIPLSLPTRLPSNEVLIDLGSE